VSLFKSLIQRACVSDYVRGCFSGLYQSAVIALLYACVCECVVLMFSPSHHRTHQRKDR